MTTKSVLPSHRAHLTLAVRWPQTESRTSMVGRWKSAPGRWFQTRLIHSNIKDSFMKPFRCAEQLGGGKSSLGKVFFLNMIKGGSFLPSAVQAIITVKRECSLPVVSSFTFQQRWRWTACRTKRESRLPSRSLPSCSHVLRAGRRHTAGILRAYARIPPAVFSKWRS